MVHYEDEGESCFYFGYATLSMIMTPRLWQHSEELHAFLHLPLLLLRAILHLLLDRF